MRISLPIALSILFLLACGGRKGSTPTEEAAPEPPLAEPSARLDTDTHAGQSAPPQDVLPSWTLDSGSTPIPCQDDDAALSYADGLRRGRLLGKEERWGEAVAALEAALSVRKADATALSELSWAALKAGDYRKALEAGKQAAAHGARPEHRAASLYNVGRAAEAMGNLALARTVYEESLSLRAHDAVRKRLEGLGATPASRSLERADGLGMCGDLPSLSEVCSCLERELARSKTEGPHGSASSGPLTCSTTEHRSSAAVVLAVKHQAEDDERIPGMYYVLALERAGTWSAVNIIETVAETDLGILPRGGYSGSIDALRQEEFQDGTLIWVMSQNRLSDSGMGEHSVSESTTLNLCMNPRSASRTAYCYAPVLVGEIEYSEGEEGCQVRDTTYVFRVALDSSGELGLVLVYGKDPAGRAGTYRL